MNRFVLSGLSACAMLAATIYGLDNGGVNNIVLGRLANGDAVTFVRSAAGDWGIEISRENISE